MKRLIYLLLVFLIGCSGDKNEDLPVWSEEDRQHLINEFEGTRQTIHALVDGLNYEQWHYKADSNAWSLAYVIEHLQLQDDMHYREVHIVSMQPTQPKYSLKTVGNDEKVNKYATTPLKTIADWNVTPLGRWPTKQLSMMAFDRSRDKLIEFIKETKADLRQQVTFRNIPDETDFRSVRNLHQILLTTIAHTKRHILQIQNMIAAEEFPK